MRQMFDCGECGGTSGLNHMLLEYKQSGDKTVRAECGIVVAVVCSEDPPWRD